MALKPQDLLLYAVTDKSWLSGREFLSVVEEAVRNGVTMLQLREKELEFDAFLEQAKAVQAVTDKYQIPLIINDNPEIAAQIGAEGVHVGQSDMDARDVRGIIGKDKIMGVSARTVAEAVRAEACGADYIGVGAVFGTNTKKDAAYVPRETLLEITKAVSIPVVAIGGIAKNNILSLKGSGIAGVSVISAIFAQKDIGAATAELLDLVRQVVQ